MKVTFQTIPACSDEMVLIRRADFDALVAAVRETEEDDDDVAVFDERLAELEAGTSTKLPAEVSAAMLSGSTRLRALRKWRGVTQDELAKRSGLAQGYISDLEAGRKAGSAETASALASALDVDLAWLSP